MDLGIAGKWAVVCASSKGLGKGCAQALVREGVNVVINARGEAALQATAQELRALHPGVNVVAVAADIATPAGQAAVLSACPQVDILINNAGGPPPGDFRDWGRSQWLAALEANMLTPIDLIKSVVDGMAQRGFGVIWAAGAEFERCRQAVSGAAGAGAPGLAACCCTVAPAVEVCTESADGAAAAGWGPVAATVPAFDAVPVLVKVLAAARPLSGRRRTARPRSRDGRPRRPRGALAVHGAGDRAGPCRACVATAGEKGIRPLCRASLGLRGGGGRDRREVAQGKDLVKGGRAAHAGRGSDGSIQNALCHLGD